MTDPLTTYPDLELGELDRALRASLPLSFAPSGGLSTADVVLVHGASDWPDRVEHRLGSRTAGALVIDPRPTSAKRIRALAASDVRLVLSEPFAAHPAVSLLAQALEGTDTIVVTSYGPGAASSQLFDLLRLLRALGLGGFTSLDTLKNDESILVTLAGSRVDQPVVIRLAAVTTTAHRPRHTVRGYGLTTVVTSTLFGPQTARPATIAKSSHGDTAVVATPLESAHRVALRRFSSGTAASDLEGFASDVEFLKTLL